MAAVGLDCGSARHSLGLIRTPFTGGDNVPFLIQGHRTPSADFLERAQTTDAHLGFFIDRADANAGRRGQIIGIGIGCGI